MQSMSKSTSAAPGRPAKLTIMNTLAYIYKENGLKGLYRGVTPRIALGIWQTVCMVSFADYVKAWCVALLWRVAGAAVRVRALWTSLIRIAFCVVFTGSRASKSSGSSSDHIASA